MARWLWTQKQDVGPPRAGGMVYDSSRKRAMFLFNRTTWDWDGETWVELDDMGPAGSVVMTIIAMRRCYLAVAALLTRRVSMQFYMTSTTGSVIAPGIG